MPFTSHNAEILVVESCVEFQQRIYKALTDSFQNIQTVENLSAAWNCLTLSPIDLIVCDMDLISVADENGAAFLRQPVPIVFLNTGQQAGVIFKRLNDKSFFCLKKSVCIYLLPTIATEVLTSQKLADHSLAGQHRPPATLVMPGVMESPGAFSSIHTMY